MINFHNYFKIPKLITSLFILNLQNLTIAVENENDNTNILFDELSFDNVWQELTNQNINEAFNSEIVDRLPRYLIDASINVNLKNENYHSKEIFKKNPANEPCPVEYYYNEQSNTCLQYLNCDTIEKYTTLDSLLGEGQGKQIFKGKLNFIKSQSPRPLISNILTKNATVNVAIVKAQPRSVRQYDRGNIKLLERTIIGIQRLIELQKSKHVLKLYGYCLKNHNIFELDSMGSPTGELEPEGPDKIYEKMPVFVSELCKRGDLNGFVKSNEYKDFNSYQRVSLAYSFLQSLEFLHNSPIGVRINCDMNHLHRALSQFLVTDDLRVVLNDLDDIPDASTFSKCSWGVTESDVNNTFLAPEQTMSDDEFKNVYNSNVNYDTEKIDVWKIPEMVIYILTKGISNLNDKIILSKVLISLNPILKQCKSYKYNSRPSTTRILKIFQEIIKEMGNSRNKYKNDRLLLPDENALIMNDAFDSLQNRIK